MFNRSWTIERGQQKDFGSPIRIDIGVGGEVGIG